MNVNAKSKYMAYSNGKVCEGELQETTSAVDHKGKNNAEINVRYID